GGHREVLPDGQRREDLALLGHEAEPAARAPEHREPVQARLAHPDLAAVERRVPDAGGEERGLAHAVPPDHADALAWSHGEREVLEDDGLSVARAHRPERQRASHAPPRPGT